MYVKLKLLFDFYMFWYVLIFFVDILSKLICEAKIPDDVTKLMQEGRPVIFNKLIHNLQLFTKSYVFTGDSFLTAQVSTVVILYILLVCVCVCETLY